MLLLPRRRLLKRASKRPGERGACAFACPPPSSPPISPVSPPYHDWPEGPSRQCRQSQFGMRARGKTRASIRVRGPAVFGRKGGFEDTSSAQHLCYLLSRNRRISRFACSVHFRCDMCAAALLPLSDEQCAARTMCKLPSNRPAFSRAQRQAVAEFHLAVATDECCPRAWKRMAEKTASICSYRGQGNSVVLLLLSASRPGECIQIVGCCSAGESLRRSAKVCID